MKKLILATILAFMTCLGVNAQIVYEDFEGGTSDLAWAAADGTYNGVIANPAPDAVNGSGFVGSYTKAAGFGYSLFWVPSLAQPLDLSGFNRLKLKVWCSAATPVLLKFEGTGPAIEKTAVMPAAGEWVELTFDMSKAENYTGLTKIIIFFDPGNDPSSNTYYFDDLVAEKNENIIEDFETPSGITWTDINGVFNGAVTNPSVDQYNGSTTVGSFTNDPGSDYSFAFGTLSAPLDLTTYNQFKIKMRAPKATQILFKIEGAGEAKEEVKNVAVTNAWQEYTFDFSSAKDFTTINKILVVFSPGVSGSMDTFYIDDIKAYPQGPCEGFTPDPEILDNFDCIRKATYGLGWDSLDVVKNPAPGVDNNSPKVGRVRDRAGMGTEYYPLVIDYENPIDLITNNQFGLKLWAPKTGTLLLKIEGSANNGPKEVPVQVTEINKWVEYSVDFSDQVGKGHKRLVMFFNAGVNGEDGDIYYIDDIKLASQKGVNVEDFQGTQTVLGWQPLNQDDVLHGVFTAPTANPSPNSVNNSTQVGCYAKGVSPLSTLQAFSLTDFDLSTYSQFNIDVLSPAAAAVGTVVRMQLSSPTQGNKEAEATISTPGAWETLGFDFSAFSAITDFSEVRLIFDPGTAASGASWCIDNLTQSLTTVDPCLGTVPDLQIVDDFECQRNYDNIFYGASDLKVVNNPHQTTDNASLKVGEYTDPAGAGTEFAGIGFQLPAPPDLSLANQLEVQVYAPFDNVPFLFKLQTGGAQVEIFDTLPEKNKWYTFSIDFSSAVNTTNTQLVIFPNVLSPTGGGTYFIDNIRWRRAGYNGCVGDQEAANTTLGNFTYFNNNPYDGQTAAIVDNPAPGGINTSTKVIRYIQSASAPIFSGAYAQLDANIDFKGTKQIKAKVWMDHLGLFTMKVEVFGNQFPAVEIDQPNTKVNEWEELTFDFSAVTDDAKYPRLTVLVDKGGIGTGTDVVTYFDDIVIGEGACGIIGTFTPRTIEAMRIAPNPVSDRLRVEIPDGVVRMDVYNVFGQRLTSINVSGTQANIEVSGLSAGIYTLTGFNEQGVLVGNAKFVKQ
ncbi:MAG: T9SS type A sorting domain-containing protein [Lewinellaceae bacterium]|nr:T9SS type A sorting domain-containing protein [Lewinellaceae bacterium]